MIRALALSPAGEWIASVSQDETLRVWNASTGTLSDTIRIDGVPTCLVAQGNRFFVGCEDTTICVYEHTQKAP